MKTTLGTAKVFANTSLSKNPHLDREAAIPNFRLLDFQDKQDLIDVYFNALYQEAYCF